METLDKNYLLGQGLEKVREFSLANDLPTPAVFIVRGRVKWPFKACAYYRKNEITICVPSCAHVGTSGRAWSWPGYTVDRTPFGVLAHEMGHCADFYSGAPTGKYFSTYGIAVRSYASEKPITSYCPTDAEWFAEMMRLYITNPDLLRLIRPRTYKALRDQFAPVEDRRWDEVLQLAPSRTIEAAQNKIKLASRSR